MMFVDVRLTVNARSRMLVDVSLIINAKSRVMIVNVRLNS